jgi:hypothetical protein
VGAAPHGRPARRHGMPESVPPGPTRVRGAAQLHLLEPADPGHARLLAQYDDVMHETLTQLESAFVDAEGDWADRMLAALARLLGLAAANPELTRLCTLDVFEAGQPGLDHRDHWTLRFVDLCDAAYSRSDLPRPRTGLTSQLVAGSVFELIRTHATEDRIDELLDALPTVALIALSPIVGRDAALSLTYSTTE